MESLKFKFAPYGSDNECTRTLLLFSSPHPTSTRDQFFLVSPNKKNPFRSQNLFSAQDPTVEDRGRRPFCGGRPLC